MEGFEEEIDYKIKILTFPVSKNIIDEVSTYSIQ
jgi:hypothetical protein